MAIERLLARDAGDVFHALVCEGFDEEVGCFHDDFVSNYAALSQRIRDLGEAADVCAAHVVDFIALVTHVILDALAVNCLHDFLKALIDLF